MIFSENKVPYDASTMRDIEEGLIIAEGEKPKYIQKNITENGTYRASSDNVDGYLSIVADVPNTYSLSDEGKVVNEGNLVAQSAYPTEITENDTYDTTNYNSITVNVSSSGGAGGADVIFYDYDGAVVASYSAADFANLSAMPENPTHTGLTAQGWNWSLADAKTHVATYGKLNIGQMYITSDGKTRFYCVIPKHERTFNLYLTLDNDTELDIDWGDKTGHTTWTSEDGVSSKSHEYSNGGKYTIVITVVSGGFGCQYQNGTNRTLRKIEFGSGVTSIGEHALENYEILTSVTIPSSVTSIGECAFNCCYALASIIIPSSVTSIGGGAFDQCYALTSITIPSGVTSIEEDVFSGCSALASITIPSSVTSIGEQAFYGCYALASITIPSSVTSIGEQAFYGCYALTSITIPSSVTSIGEYVFQYCYALASITIPISVTSIGESAFSDCTALTSITFESGTPPELSGDLSLPATCIIRVPGGVIPDYKEASNYPDPHDYIYEGY